MLSFFKREPSQLDILLALLTLEINEKPEKFRVRIPSYSDFWTIIDGPDFKVTTVSGLCGSGWKGTKLNGIDISNRKVRTLIKLQKYRLTCNQHKRDIGDNEEIIERIINRRKEQRRLK